MYIYIYVSYDINYFITWQIFPFPDLFFKEFKMNINTILEMKHDFLHSTQQQILYGFE